jgi:LysM repeat protein
VGTGPALAANVQTSGAVVQRVTWDDSLGTTGVAARPANYQPQASAVSSTYRNPATHQVVKGETLYSLARRYNTNVNDLAALNNIAADGLQIGMVLRLPHSGAEG